MSYQLKEIANYDTVEKVNQLTLDGCKNLDGIRPTLPALAVFGPKPKPSKTSSGSGFLSSRTDSTLLQWLSSD